MDSITKMQIMVRRIKADYREKIHRLRWQEKNDIAEQINQEFNTIFPINSQFKFNNIYDTKVYTVTDLNDYYIYFTDSISSRCLKKDEAIFQITPVKYNE